MKQSVKRYAILYNSDNVIVSELRKMQGTIYCASDNLMAEFDTESELDEFITKNKLNYEPTN